MKANKIISKCDLMTSLLTHAHILSVRYLATKFGLDRTYGEFVTHLFAPTRILTHSDTQPLTHSFTFLN